MRKFTLIVMTALFAVTAAVAQPGVVNRQKHQSRMLAGTAIQHQRLNPATAAETMAKSRAIEERAKVAQAKAAATKASRVSEDDIILEQPNGKFIDGSASYNAVTYNWLVGLQYAETTGAPSALVEGADGNLYIQGLVSGYNDAWVKAVPAGGDKYTISPQLVALYNYGEDEDGNIAWDEYYVKKMDITFIEEDGETYIDYVEAEDPSFEVIYKDGVLTVPEELQSDADPTQGIWPETVIGVDCVYLGEYDGWYALEWNVEIVEFKDKVTTLPASATVEQFAFTHVAGGAMVPVAFVGDKVYLQLTSSVEGWVVGTIKDNTVTIKSDQYVGAYGNYRIYFEGTTYEYDEEGYLVPEVVEELVFDFDADKRSITTDDAFILFYSATKGNWSPYLAYFVDPKIAPFKYQKGIPQDPYFTYLSNGFETGYGDYVLVDVKIPNISTEGNLLDTDRISYRVWVDGDEFAFEPDEYGTDQTYVEVPYSLDLGYGSGLYYYSDTYGHEITFYFEAEDIAVQAIHRAEGEIGLSNIVHLDVAEGAFWTEEGTSSLPGADAISETAASSQIVSEANYDALGRQVAAGTKGFVMKTITFADGTKKTVKVIRK